MKADEVTKRQARIVKAKLEPTLDYMTRLRQRMAQRGFDGDDTLMALVSDAERALQALCVDLLIRTEDGPTALPPAQPPKSLGISKRAQEVEERAKRMR
jgi:hypothetical protein